VNFYDGDHVIAEYEGDTLVRKFIYGPAIDEPILKIQNRWCGNLYLRKWDFGERVL